MYPASPPHQALLIVCIFGVVLGGLNLTAVYRPSFYGFVLPALVPLIVRVALEGDQVHLYTALVMSVVLALRPRVRAPAERRADAIARDALREHRPDRRAEGASRARRTRRAPRAETANRGKSQLLAAASHDLRQPLHALGLYIAALAARAATPSWRPLVAQRAGRRRRAGRPVRAAARPVAPRSGRAVRRALARVPLAPLLRADRERAAAAGRRDGARWRCVPHPRRWPSISDPALLERIVRNLVRQRDPLHGARRRAADGARRRGDAVAIDVVDTGIGIAPEHCARIFDEFYQVRCRSAGRARRHGPRSCDRAPAGGAAGARDRTSPRASGAGRAFASSHRRAPASRRAALGAVARTQPAAAAAFALADSAGRRDRRRSCGRRTRCGCCSRPGARRSSVPRRCRRC